MSVCLFVFVLIFYHLNTCSLVTWLSSLLHYRYSPPALSVACTGGVWGGVVAQLYVNDGVELS